MLCIFPEGFTLHKSASHDFDFIVVDIVLLASLQVYSVGEWAPELCIQLCTSVCVRATEPNEGETNECDAMASVDEIENAVAIKAGRF